MLSFLSRMKFYLLCVMRVKVVRSAYGVKLINNINDATFRYCLIGGYGYFYSDWLHNTKERFTFIDIGANQGLYTLLAAKNPNCSRAYSFEPMPKSFNLFEQNCLENEVSHKVSSQMCGISDRSGVFQVCAQSGHSGGATLSRARFDDTKKNVQSTDVSMIDCNELSHLVSSGVEDIHIKVDVEGHELVVLNQLYKTNFFPRVKSVFVECDESWINSDELKHGLTRQGFKIEKIGEGESHYDIMATR